VSPTMIFLYQLVTTIRLFHFETFFEKKWQSFLIITAYKNMICECLFIQ
jgi:hypothetical protein